MASYGSLSGVSALIPGAGDFNTTSTPTDSEVTTWLSQGYSRINRELSAKGYQIPVVNTAAVYGELSGLNNTYAQIRVLRALGLDIIQGTEQNKAEQLQAEFDEQLDKLACSDLTNAGVAVAAASTGKRRRGISSVQLRRVDGYSGQYSGSYQEYDSVSD